MRGQGPGPKEQDGSLRRGPQEGECVSQEMEFGFGAWGMEPRGSKCLNPGGDERPRDKEAPGLGEGPAGGRAGGK